eukprot:6086864-Amphidinium_carterae.3
MKRCQAERNIPKYRRMRSAHTCAHALLIIRVVRMRNILDVIPSPASQFLLCGHAGWHRPIQ